MDEPETVGYALWIRLIGQTSLWTKYLWGLPTPEKAIEAWKLMLATNTTVIGCCILREDEKP